MVKNHLKRIAAPRTWNILRKETVFITGPNPGAHTLAQGVALTTFLREIVRVAKTSREVKHILNHGTVLVDGIKRKEPRFNVGLMDVISLPDSKQYFRLTLDEKGRLSAVAVDAKEANKKLAQVKNITTIKGGKTQLTLSDGRAVTVAKKECSVGDVVLIEVPSQKILKQFTLSDKKPVFLTGGKHAGKKAVVQSVDKNMIVIETADKEKHTTKKEYAFIIGDKDEELTL